MSRTVPSRVLPILTVTDVRQSRVLPTPGEMTSCFKLAYKNLLPLTRARSAVLEWNLNSARLVPVSPHSGHARKEHRDVELNSYQTSLWQQDKLTLGTTKKQARLTSCAASMCCWRLLDRSSSSWTTLARNFELYLEKNNNNNNKTKQILKNRANFFRVSCCSLNVTTCITSSSRWLKSVLTFESWSPSSAVVCPKLNIWK